MIKISVLMPVYNGEKFLRDAIQSIIDQTYTDWELIIINDGSTDNSEKIIQTFADKRIQYYKNDKNIGLIDTLNKGIEYCKGEYIARMDADDISISERLENQFNFLDEHKKYAMCGCNATVINGENEVIGEIVNLYSNEYLQINLLFSVPFIHPSMMIRTQIIKEFQYNKKYKHAEDYDLWCRIADKNQISNLPKSLLKYRWHTSNISVAHSNNQEVIKNQIIRRQLSNYLGLIADEDDLYLHKISFKQYSSKENKELDSFDRYNDLSNWFKKIIDANILKKNYDENALISYLWSRWIVLCIAQKKYSKIFKPHFVPYRVKILSRTLQLVHLLSKK